MSTRIDDRLFAALVSGDDKALSDAWQTLFAVAYLYAVRLLGGKGRCISGQSAEDVAAQAVLKFVEAVNRGNLELINLHPYLLSIVRNLVIDLYRRREVQVVDPEPGEGVNWAESIADTAPTPEQALIERQEAAARRRAAVERLRLVRRAWCEWPDRMSRWCRRRPALAAMLAQMKRYLWRQLMSAQSTADQAGSKTLLELAESAEPEWTKLSLVELNAFAQRTLAITRVTLDQRWRQLRRIAAAHGIPQPPGLSRGNGARAQRLLVSRTQQVQGARLRPAPPRRPRGLPAVTGAFRFEDRPRRRATDPPAELSRRALSDNPFVESSVLDVDAVT